MSPGAKDSAPGGVAICDQAWRLVRAEVFGALPYYYIGSLPFALSIAWLWYVTTSDPLALQRLPLDALFVALAFVWMKTWQARYAQLLLARVQDTSVPAYGVRAFLRSASVQAGLQSASWIALPLALLFTVPFAWVYAFFQSATVVEDGSRGSAREVAEDALQHARVWPKQNHILIWLFSPFLIQLNAVYFYVVLPLVESYLPTMAQVIAYLFGGLFLLVCVPLCPLGLVSYLNIAAAIAMVFMLLKTFFGIDTVFTIAPGTLQNSASFVAAVLLIGLCLDPFLKAAYVIRVFHSRAQTTGEDIKIRLHALRAGKAATLLVLAALFLSPALAQEPAAGGIEADELGAAIKQSLESDRYNWRLPPNRGDEEATPVFGGINRILRNAMEWLRDTLQGIGEWIRDFFLGDSDEEDVAADMSSGIAAFREVLRVLLVMLSILLVLVLLLVFYRAWQTRNQVVALDAEALAATTAPDLEDESTSADQLPEEGWLELAREFQAKGEHRLAIRALFLATLARLAHLGFIRIAKSKSNRDYRRELERRGHVLPEVVQAFQDSAGVYDAVWYGAHEAGAEKVARLFENRERLRGHA